MAKKKFETKKTNILEEEIIDKRTTKRGKKAKSVLFLHEHKDTKERFVRLAQAFETSKKGSAKKKWAM